MRNRNSTTAAKLCSNRERLPRKELDQSRVSLAQAKAQYQLANQHLAATLAIGKPQGEKSATGQLTSAKGKFEGAAAQFSYTEIRSPIDGSCYRSSFVSRGDADGRHAFADDHGYGFGHRQGAYTAGRSCHSESR